MKKINILSVHALKEKLYIAFMRFVNSAIDDYEILTLWFAFYINKFKVAYAHLDDVYLKYDIDECTKAVNEADTARDKAFRKLRDNLRMFVMYPQSEAKKQAAEVLMRIVELYGGSKILKLGLPAKTAAYSNLVEDFEKKYPAEVTAAGVAEDVQELKAAQATFDEKYMARAKCESDFVKGAMADARKQMDEYYRLLVDAVNVKVYEDTEGKLTDFINLMNVEIGRYRTYTGQGQVGASSGSGNLEGPENGPENSPNDSENSEGSEDSENSGEQGGGSGSLTPDPDAPTNPDNGGNTNPGGGYVPPSNGGGFD